MDETLAIDWLEEDGTLALYSWRADGPVPALAREAVHIEMSLRSLQERGKSRTEIERNLELMLSALYGPDGQTGVQPEEPAATPS